MRSDDFTVGELLDQIDPTRQNFEGSWVPQPRSDLVNMESIDNTSAPVSVSLSNTDPTPSTSFSDSVPRRTSVTTEPSRGYHGAGKHDINPCRNRRQKASSFNGENNLLQLLPNRETPTDRYVTIEGADVYVNHPSQPAVPPESTSTTTKLRKRLQHRSTVHQLSSLASPDINFAPQSRDTAVTSSIERPLPQYKPSHVEQRLWKHWQHWQQYFLQRGNGDISTREQAIQAAAQETGEKVENIRWFFIQRTVASGSTPLTSGPSSATVTVPSDDLEIRVAQFLSQRWKSRCHRASPNNKPRKRSDKQRGGALQPKIPCYLCPTLCSSKPLWTRHLEGCMPQHIYECPKCCSITDRRVSEHLKRCGFDSSDDRANIIKDCRLTPPIFRASCGFRSCRLDFQDWASFHNHVFSHLEDAGWKLEDWDDKWEPSITARAGYYSRYFQVGDSKDDGEGFEDEDSGDDEDEERFGRGPKRPRSNQSPSKLSGSGSTTRSSEQRHYSNMGSPSYTRGRLLYPHTRRGQDFARSDLLPHVTGTSFEVNAQSFDTDALAIGQGLVGREVDSKDNMGNRYSYPFSMGKDQTRQSQLHASSLNLTQVTSDGMPPRRLQMPSVLDFAHFDSVVNEQLQYTQHYIFSPKESQVTRFSGTSATGGTGADQHRASTAIPAKTGKICTAFNEIGKKVVNFGSRSDMLVMQSLMLWQSSI